MLNLRTSSIGCRTNFTSRWVTLLRISAVAGIIIVVYLVIANVAGSRRSEDGVPRYIACIESDIEARTCWAVPQTPLPGAASDIPQS